MHQRGGGDRIGNRLQRLRRLPADVRARIDQRGHKLPRHLRALMANQLMPRILSDRRIAIAELRDPLFWVVHRISPRNSRAGSSKPRASSDEGAHSAPNWMLASPTRVDRRPIELRVTVS